MSELNDALVYAEKLQSQVDCLKAENAELRKSLQDSIYVVRCCNCRHSVVFKGRLLCTHDAIIQDNGDIWGATAKEEQNFCMYGQGE